MQPLTIFDYCPNMCSFPALLFMTDHSLPWALLSRFRSPQLHSLSRKELNPPCPGPRKGHFLSSRVVYQLICFYKNRDLDGILSFPYTRYSSPALLWFEGSTLTVSRSSVCLPPGS